jgi:hypothetical protein
MHRFSAALDLKPGIPDWSLIANTGHDGIGDWPWPSSFRSTQGALWSIRFLGKIFSGNGTRASHHPDWIEFNDMP